VVTSPTSLSYGTYPYLSIQEVWWGQNRPGTTFCDRLDFNIAMLIPIQYISAEFIFTLI
jgi:hypothetical protein